MQKFDEIDNHLSVEGANSREHSLSSTHHRRAQGVRGFLPEEVEC